MIKLGRGERTPIPDALMYVLIAAAFGTTPAAVRAWPADDYVMARAALPALQP